MTSLGLIALFAKFYVGSTFAMLTIFPCPSEAPDVKLFRDRAARIYIYVVTPTIFVAIASVASKSIYGFAIALLIVWPPTLLYAYLTRKAPGIVELNDNKRFLCRYGLLVAGLLLFGLDLVKLSSP